MRIIYKDAEGLKQIVPSIHYKGTMEELAIKRVPKGLDYKIIDESELPDREFRNAWDYDFSNDDPIEINIDKAKEIKKDKLRIERKSLLEALDIEVMKNIKDTKKLDEIEAEKQVLRDITKKVDACKTIDEIKSIEV